MSLPSEQSSVIYVGNNSTYTPYPIPYIFYTGDDIVVTITDITGVSTVLVPGSGYTVIGGDDSAGATGSLTTAIAVPSTSHVTIDRTLDIIQSTAFTDLGRFPSASIDRAYDYLTMVCQQIARSVSTIFCTSAEAVSGLITNKAVSPATLLSALQQAAFSAGSYLMATLQQAVAGVSSTTVINPVSLGWVLRPEFHADATDAGIRAAAAFAGVSGGVVMIPAGTIQISSPIVLTAGVVYQGAGTSWDSLTNNYTAGVGTILLGDGTFPCFQYNPTDNSDPTGSGNVSPISNCLKGGGIKDITVSGFSFGIKIGALNKSGVTPVNISNITAANCTAWGVWLENCQSGDVSNVAALGNTLGGIEIAGSTPNWNMGNFRVNGIYVQAPNGLLSKGLWIEGRNNCSLNAITSYDLECIGGAPTAYTGTATITNGTADISVPDITKFAVDSAVTFSSTVGNIISGVAYFVYSKSGTSGVGTIRIGNIIAATGGNQITPSASGTPTITNKGMSNLAIVGRGSSGGFVSGTHIFNTELEIPGTVNFLIQGAAYSDIHFGLGLASICVRGSFSDNQLYNGNPNIVMDVDSTSQRILYHGLKPATFPNGFTGCGMFFNSTTVAWEIVLQGGGGGTLTTNPQNYSQWLTPERFIQGNFGNGGDLGNPSNGNVCMIVASANSNLTLPTITATNVGVHFWLVNRDRTSTATFTAATGQLINNAVGVTTITVGPSETKQILAVQNGSGGGYFWAMP